MSSRPRSPAAAPRAAPHALATLALLGLALLVSGCAQQAEVREPIDLPTALRAVESYESARVRAQRYADVRVEDLDVDEEGFDHLVAIQDSGFTIDRFDPLSRLVRLRYDEIESITVEWDPRGLLVPFATVGILGPTWYRAWLDLTGGRKVFLGRDRTTEQAPLAWADPRNFLSAPMAERVQAFEFLRRRAREGPGR